MLEAKLDVIVDSPPDRAWALVGPFDSLARWHPEVTHCEGGTDDQGRAIRTVTYANGQVVVERETHRDESAMSYLYTIDKGKVPARFFNGQLQVVGNAGQSRVVWTASYEVPEGFPEERAKAVIAGILQSAEPGLKEKLGPKQ